MVVVINTPTLKDYEEVIMWALKDTTRRWGSGSRSIHREHWEEYESETCIFIRKDEITYCTRTHIFDNYKSLNILDMEKFRRHVEDESINLFERNF